MVLAVAGCCLLTSPAGAAIYSVSGSWSATLNGQGFTNEPIVGSASFTFDESMIVSSTTSLDYIQGPLTSFSFSPNPIGTTTFDLSNTAFYVTFNGNELYQIIIGGTIGTTPGVAQNTDDFYVVENLLSNDFMALSVASFSTELASNSNGMITGDNIQFTVTEIPEPGSVVLLGLGAVGVAVAIARRQRVNPRARVLR